MSWKNNDLPTLAYRQCKRFFVEKAFRECKKELGLNEYQVRSEQGWNKHMTMIMLAQLFLNEVKIYQYEQSQLRLTTQDVIGSLKSIFRLVMITIENYVDNILRRQPLNKRLLKKYYLLESNKVELKY